MIKEAIIKIVNKEDLTYDEAYTVMNEIMSGQTSQTQNAAFLAALSTKSTNAETTEEIAGCAAAMREQATSVETGMETLEIVGTGGDGAHSFNISTTAAMIIAAAGVKVTKHGNRAASSLSGLGFRTVFNILGPLTNPAKPSMMILGVYDGALVEPLAKVLSSLGVKRGMVVYGTDKLDEISISAPTKICEVDNGIYRSYVIAPELFGLKSASREDIVGGTAEENAAVTRGILDGSITGPKRDIVLLNSGAALFTAGKANSMYEGIELARKMIESGKASATLDNFVRYSNE